MHPDTEAAAFAIYGRWGQGKSTYMRLLRKEMLLTAANDVADSHRNAVGKKEVIQQYSNTMSDKRASKAHYDVALDKLAREARPRLVYAWFNAW